jgi:hypothetical protein
LPVQQPPPGYIPDRPRSAFGIVNAEGGAILVPGPLQKQKANIYVARCRFISFPLPGSPG